MKNLKALLLVISSFLFTSSLSAANRYWIATTTANWNSTLNWSTTSGGAGGASVPGSADVAIFNAAKVGSCTINANVNVLGVSIVSGYTGTISQGTYTITVGTTGYSQAAGTFSGGSGTISAKLFTLTGGTFTSTSGNFTVGTPVGNATIFTHSGGTFNHNNGTVTFGANTSTAVYTVDVITGTLFYNVVANLGTGLGTYNSTMQSAGTDTVKATNTFTHSSSTLKGFWRTQGNLVVSSAANGGTGQIIMFGTGNKSYSYSSGRTCNLVINKSSGVVSPVSLTNNLAVRGFKLVAGSFTAPSVNFNIGGTLDANATVFDHIAGTYTHNSGTTVFDVGGGFTVTIKTLNTTVLNHTTINSKGTLVLQNATDTLRVNNLTLSQGAFNTGLIQVKGNATVTNTFDGTGKIAFMGTVDQNFTLTGATDKFNVTNLIIKQSPGKKVILQSAAILDQSGQSVTFTRGNIVSTATNLLTIGHGVTVSGMSNSSYVDGPMKKVGNAAFTFPVGKYGLYRRIGISAPTSTTDAYTAEYFESNSNYFYSHLSKDASLAQMSRNEYWNLARTTGTSNVSVTLSIDSATSCSVDNLSNVKVAAWNGTTWKDKGNGGTTGNVYEGTVVSNGASNVFGIYAIGTSTTLGCYLGHGESPKCSDALYSNPDTTGNALPDSVFPFHMIDRFGNKYSYKDLAIDTISTDINQNKRNIGGLCTTSGYFNLIFENGSGMENINSQLHNDRRNVICQVFQDISDFITPPNPNIQVNIWVKRLQSIVPQPGGVLGVATAIYSIPTDNSGYDIADGQVWRTITSGVDGYTGIAPPVQNLNLNLHDLGFFHGLVAFNFSNNQIQWHTDLDAMTAADRFDLYSVALHEVTHALGFNSLIACDGTSRFGTGYRYYSRYDLFLENNNGTSLITNSGNCDYYDYTFNAQLNPTTLLSPMDIDCTIDDPDCIFDQTTCNTAIRFSGIFDEPVYTPNCYENGSSLSHFEDVCHLSNACNATNAYTNNLYYVMSDRNGIGPNFMKRFLKEEERAVLCDLGYAVDDIYGNQAQHSEFDYCNASCPGISVVGVHDGVTNGVFVYTTTINVALTIDDILDNDFNATNGFTCPQVHAGAGSINNITTIGFDYTPVSTGIKILKYIPVGPNNVQGNVTYVLVYVLPASTCTPGACDLINNGGFEQPVSGDLGCANLSNLLGWQVYGSSPDLFWVNCTSPNYDIPTPYSNPPSNSWNNGANNNNHFLGLYSGYNQNNFWNDNEGFQTTLCTPIVPGRSYNISCHVKVANDANFENEDLTFEIGGATGVLAPFETYNPFVLTNFFQGNIEADNSWHQISFTYDHVGPEVLTQFVIGVHSELLPLIPNGTRYMYIDDISVTQVEDLCCNINHTVPNATTWNGGASLSTMPVTNSTITSQAFTIAGLLTISEDLTLTDCNVILNNDAEIVLEDNAILTLTGGTHLHACGVDLWKRIYVPNGCRIEVNNAIIEDAETGVYVDYGICDIDDVVFNKNFIHVYLKGATGDGSLDEVEIMNSSFLCEDGQQNPVVLLAPHGNTRTSYGIETIYTDLNCGQTSNGNLFRNLNLGMYTHHKGKIHIFDNTFDHLNLGIHCQNNSENIIEENTMTDIATVGVFVRESYNGAVDINENNFSDNIGWAGVWCNDNRSAEIEISGNVIDFTDNIPNSGFGIAVTEVLPNIPFKFKAQQNEITRARCGVWALNLTGQIDLNQNTGTVYVGDHGYPGISQSKTINDASAGILMQNCRGSIVTNNFVTSSSGYSFPSWIETGIRMELGNWNAQTCNYIDDIGRGLFVSGNVWPAGVAQNTFSLNESALFLNYGILGQQGIAGSPHDNVWSVNTPWSSTSYFASVVYDNDPDINNVTSGASSAFRVRTGVVPNLYNPPTASHIGGGQANPNPIPFSTVSGTYTEPCEDFNPGFFVSNTPWINEAKAIAQNNSLDSDIEINLKWMAQYGLYKYLPLNATLMGDNDLDAFYDSCFTSNMGVLDRSLEPLAIYTTDWDTAEVHPWPIGNIDEEYLDSLQDMTAANNTEENLIDFLSILYENVVDSIEASVSDINTIRDIAELCPYTDGFGVYMARAWLLQYDTIPTMYTNECEYSPDPGSNKWDGDPNEIPQNEEGVSASNLMFQLYPNPANGLMILDYDLADLPEAYLSIRNVFGQSIINKLLKAGKNKVDINFDEVAAGIYVAEITAGKDMLHKEKIIIFK